MQTIKLKVSDKIVKNLMWFLGRFDKDEIQVIGENSEFVSVQKYMQDELSKLENGNAEFINIDELDDHLEATIRSYET